MDLSLRLNISGSGKYEKVSYPVRYGRLAEIVTPGHRFQFNLNGEIKFLQGLGRDWPHPNEWLKRSAGNHWIYYDGGGYNQIFDYLGEYYLPCFTYDTNSLWDTDPFRERPVQEALEAFQQLSKDLKHHLKDGNWSEEEKTFLSKAESLDPQALQDRADQLNSIIKSRVSVLPPDSRHVDYDCLPLIIADGCLYHCAFCRIQSNQDFQIRSRADIQSQLQQLRTFYGPDIRNYNSLFLGQHDALLCGRERIVSVALQAYEVLELEQSYLEGSHLFLFGSVDSFLRAEEGLFEKLNSLPYRTWLNLGLESADQESLNMLGKPLRVREVEEAFRRMIAINHKYDRLEVTANFVVDLTLPPGHWESLERLARESLSHYVDKGAIYLSPLSRNGRNELRQRFRALKMKSRLPLYLYLLQRL
jgi:hypothetical protein